MMYVDVVVVIMLVTLMMISNPPTPPTVFIEVVSLILESVSI